MTKFILFIAFFFSTLSASELKTDLIKHNIKTIFYHSHSYICFNDNFFLHDPSCGCDSRWCSITKDNQGNIINSSSYIRMPVSHYD